MIAAIGLGALAGGVVFLLVLHLAQPRPAPLVELASFDAAHEVGGAAAQSLAAEPGAGRLPGLPATAGAWLAQTLTRRGITNTTLYSWISKGIIPPGFPLGPNTRAWTVEEIDALIRERAAARPGQPAE